MCGLLSWKNNKLNWCIFRFNFAGKIKIAVISSLFGKLILLVSHLWIRLCNVLFHLLLCSRLFMCLHINDSRFMKHYLPLLPCSLDIFCSILFCLIFKRAIKVMGYGLPLENLNFHHPIFKKQQWLKTLGADVWFCIPAPSSQSSVILFKFPIFFVIQPRHL